MADAFVRKSTEAAVTIPEIWSAKIYDVLRNSLVARNLVNENYAGEIKARGDTVHIVTIPEGGAATSITEGTAVDASTATITENQLVINKYYGYDVAVSQLALIESNINLMDGYAQQAGFALAKQLDTDVIAALSAASAAAPDHIIAGSGAAGIFNPNDDVLTAKGLLDTQNVPEDQRWMLLNPFDYNVILAVAANQSRDYVPGQPLVTGQVAPLFGFMPFKSNQLAAGTVLFGHSSACTLAVQKEVQVRFHSMEPQGIRAERIVTDILYGIKLLSDVRVVKLNAAGA